MTRYIQAVNPNEDVKKEDSKVKKQKERVLNYLTKPGNYTSEQLMESRKIYSGDGGKY